MFSRPTAAALRLVPRTFGFNERQRPATICGVDREAQLIRSASLEVGRSAAAFDRGRPPAESRKNARHPERSEGSAFRALLGCNSILVHDPPLAVITTRHPPTCKWYDFQNESRCPVLRIWRVLLSRNSPLAWGRRPISIPISTLGLAGERHSRMDRASTNGRSVPAVSVGRRRRAAPAIPDLVRRLEYPHPIPHHFAGAPGRGNNFVLFARGLECFRAFPSPDAINHRPTKRSPRCHRRFHFLRNRSGLTIVARDPRANDGHRREKSSQARRNRSRRARHGGEYHVRRSTRSRRNWRKRSAIRNIIRRLRTQSRSASLEDDSTRSHHRYV